MPRIDTIWIVLRVEGETALHERAFIDREKIYRLLNDPDVRLFEFLRGLLPLEATAEDITIVAHNSVNKSLSPDRSKQIPAEESQDA